MKRNLNDLADIVAEKLSDDNVDKIARSLWFELQKQKKISHLDEILEKVRQKQAEKNNQAIIEVISASELSDDQKKDLQSKLEQKVGKKVATRYFVNDKLLGGMKIKINDEVLDLSWRGKLDKIKQLSGR